MKENSSAPEFFYSPTLGISIPLDCCPRIFIEQEEKAMLDYLKNGSIFRRLAEPKENEDG